MPPSLGAVHVFKQRTNLLNKTYTKFWGDPSQKRTCGQFWYISAWHHHSNWDASKGPAYLQSSLWEWPTPLFQLLPRHPFSLLHHALTFTTMALRAPTLKNLQISFLNLLLDNLTPDSTWHKHRKVHSMVILYSSMFVCFLQKEHTCITIIQIKKYPTCSLSITEGK